MIRKYIMIASALLCGSIFTACNDDNDTPTFPEKTETTYDMSGFARGADVSWLSEMESSGYKFYTSDGKEQECMSLLRDLGINAIRLRVWVNPENDTEDVKGWCNKGDVLLKAWRAHNLGYRLMIDFHYSDRSCSASQTQSLGKLYGRRTGAGDCRPYQRCTRCNQRDGY